MIYTDLSRIPVGTCARVKSLKANENIRRRLLDIGLTPHAETTCLYQSPAGDPRAYLVCGAVIALRTEDARQVQVTYSKL